MNKAIMRVGVAVVAIGIAIGTAPAAMAGTDAKAETAGAWAYFGAYGEHLNVKDTNGTDNTPVRAQLNWNGAVRATLWATGGGGATNTTNLTIVDGTPVSLQVCRVVKDSGYVFNCSAWVPGTA